jgi:hypothetical protein
MIFYHFRRQSVLCGPDTNEKNCLYLALGIDGCVSLQQQLGHLHVAVLGCQVEWRESLLGGRGEGGAIFQQDGSHLVWTNVLVFTYLF